MGVGEVLVTVAFHVPPSQLCDYSHQNHSKQVFFFLLFPVSVSMDCGPPHGFWQQNRPQTQLPTHIA